MGELVPVTKKLDTEDTVSQVTQGEDPVDPGERGAHEESGEAEDEKRKFSRVT